jgi:hypothetical protein
MSDFVDKLRLKESAEEDLYFARQDRELIEVLHRERLAKADACTRAGGATGVPVPAEPISGGRRTDRGARPCSRGRGRALLDALIRVFTGRRRP